MLKVQCLHCDHKVKPLLVYFDSHPIQCIQKRFVLFLGRPKGNEWSHENGNESLKNFYMLEPLKYAIEKSCK